MANTVFMLWIIVSFCGLLLLSIITGVFLFVLRRQTILRILMPDKSIYTKRYFFKQLPKTIDLKELGIYFIDENCMFKTFFGYVLHYTYNNPEPIEHMDVVQKNRNISELTVYKKHKLFSFPVDFKITESIPTDIKRRAQNIEKFHNDGLIKELFSRENLTNIILILVIVGLIVSVCGIGYNIMSSPSKSSVMKCQLVDSANNSMIISNGVNKALMKGGIPDVKT